MCKSTYNAPFFRFHRRFALFRHLNNRRKILISFIIRFNMHTAWVSCCSTCKYALAHLFASGGNNAICSEQYWPVKGFKFGHLCPPRTTIVPYKIVIFFKSRIIVAWEHFTVGIYINTCTFGLFKQLLQIC